MKRSLRIFPSETTELTIKITISPIASGLSMRNVAPAINSGNRLKIESSLFVIQMSKAINFEDRLKIESTLFG